MLCFKFTPGAYAPFYPDTHKGCIGGCDTNFMELLGIRPLASQARTQNHSYSSNTSMANETGNSSGYASGSQSSGYSTNSSRASGSSSRATASVPPQRPQQPRQTSSSSNERNPTNSNYGGAGPSSYAGTSRQNFPSQSNHRQPMSGRPPNQRPEDNQR